MKVRLLWVDRSFVQISRNSHLLMELPIGLLLECGLKLSAALHGGFDVLSCLRK